MENCWIVLYGRAAGVPLRADWKRGICSCPEKSKDTRQQHISRKAKTKKKGNAHGNKAINGHERFYLARQAKLGSAKRKGRSSKKTPGAEPSDVKWANLWDASPGSGREGRPGPGTLPRRRGRKNGRHVAQGHVSINEKSTYFSSSGSMRHRKRRGIWKSCRRKPPHKPKKK